MTEYFPGSAQPLGPVPGSPREVPRSKRTFHIGDQEVELFTIGEVAVLLNRRPVTLRKWERDKVIPRATYTKAGAGGDERGKRRLYSRPQVEALVTIAEEEKILHNPNAQISRTKFSEKVWAAFRRIAVTA